MNHKTLAKHAAEARENSHSPYSKFRVGAALLTRTGKVYTGCNIEISTFALTICAERTALFKAYSEGQRNFTAIAVATDEDDFTAPCGACRQVIMDLAGDIDFVMSKANGEIKVVRMSELFPYPFGPKNLDKHKKKKAS
jgi:cytidine deaminase